MFVDGLHHTDDATVLLRETRRVSRQVVLIKDHYTGGVAADFTLRLMDWVGNAPHGVRPPYSYCNRSRWRSVGESKARKLQISRVTTSSRCIRRHS